MKIEANESRMIYFSKSIAIFCVICAHSTPISDKATALTQISSQLLNYLGTMGVPVFFLLSGYLFEKNTKSFIDFWKTKIGSIVIPWIFCETLLWIYVVVRSGEISILGWLLFIIGYKHTTYYMTVLIVFYLLFFKFKSKWFLIVSIVISIISILSQGWKMGINFISNYTGTYYLNPLNWMVFFCVGILISRNMSLSILAGTLKRITPIMFIISVAYFMITLTLGEYIYYFSKFCIIPLTVNTFLIFVGGYLLAGKGSKNNVSVKLDQICMDGYIELIGIYAYTIYLLHQFFAGIVVKITGLKDFFVLVLIRPFIILGMTMLLISILVRLKGSCGSLIRKLCGVKV